MEVCGLDACINSTTCRRYRDCKKHHGPRKARIALSCSMAWSLSYTARLLALCSSLWGIAMRHTCAYNDPTVFPKYFRVIVPFFSRQLRANYACHFYNSV